jgi:hypothetical protein
MKCLRSYQARSRRSDADKFTKSHGTISQELLVVAVENTGQFLRHCFADGALVGLHLGQIERPVIEWMQSYIPGHSSTTLASARRKRRHSSLIRISHRTRSVHGSVTGFALTLSTAIPTVLSIVRRVLLKTKNAETIRTRAIQAPRIAVAAP